jgi:hypothetical protein
MAAAYRSSLGSSNPNEFLLAVENAINASSSPFDELFDQEDAGAFGGNYITGLLWAARLLPIFAIRNTFLPVFRYRFSPARFMCAESR